MLLVDSSTTKSVSKIWSVNKETAVVGDETINLVSSTGVTGELSGPDETNESLLGLKTNESDGVYNPKCNNLEKSCSPEVRPRRGMTGLLNSGMSSFQSSSLTGVVDAQPGTWKISP